MSEPRSGEFLVATRSDDRLGSAAQRVVHGVIGLAAPRWVPSMG